MSRTLLLRTVFIATAVCLTGYEIRHSADVMAAQQTLTFIPFRLAPFSTRIAEVAYMYGRDPDLVVGNEILAVNDRPLTGASVFAQELDASLTQAVDRELGSLKVTIRNRLGTIRSFQVYRPNCGCGGFTNLEVFCLAVAPEALCALAGLVVVALRPASRISWIFLGLALSFSQIVIMGDHVNDWLTSAIALTLRDWTRVPTILFQSFFAHSWMVWLILLTGSFSGLPTRARRWRMYGTVAIFACYAALKAAEAIIWSEHLAWRVGLYRLLESPFMLVAGVLSCVTMASAFGGKGLLASALLAIACCAIMFWPQIPELEPPSFTRHETLSLRRSQFTGRADLAVATFAAGMLTSWLALAWRTQYWARNLALLGATFPFFASLASGTLYLAFLELGLYPRFWAIDLTLALFGIGVISLAIFVARYAALDLNRSSIATERRA